MSAGAIAPQGGLLYAVGIDQDCGLGVALARAFVDRSGDGFVREAGGDTVGLQ